MRRSLGVVLAALSLAEAAAAKPPGVRVKLLGPDKKPFLVVGKPVEVSISIVASLPPSGPLRWELYLHDRLKGSGDVRSGGEGVPLREFQARAEISHDDFTWATDKDQLGLSDDTAGLSRRAMFDVLIRGGKDGKQILAKGSAEARVHCAAGDPDPACVPDR